MKTIKYYILLVTTLLFAGACDKDFVEINTNPYAITTIDPALLFAGAQRAHIGTWYGEHTIVQQFVTPYNTGANLGFNFNEDIDEMSNPKWNQLYPGPIRSMVHAIDLLGEGTSRINLLSMLRIWKAQAFMGLVDEYGDVPYFNAGVGVNGLFYPEYDDDEEIYEDLYTEITGALNEFDPNADYVPEDLFYGKNGSIPTATPAEQIAKWKKLGNSLLVRLGMHYSKINPSKAEDIVSEAFLGGVMTSNNDNAFIKNGNGGIQADNNALRNFSYFNYAAEPFVDQLKATNDPRAKFILASFIEPGNLVGETNPDTVLANQYGVPIGIPSATIEAGAPYRGKKGTGLNYSQMNIWTIASPNAPDLYVTYAQTSLLLAEAAQRGWVTGSPQEYYENGIRADMHTYTLYPGTTPIPESQIVTYLNDPAVDFSLATTDEEAFALINTQYWIVSLRNGTEAFANFRRSDYPELSPNLANDNLDGGFVRRMSYPNVEGSSNGPNYSAASSAIGGDNLLSRVFWDVE